MSSIRENLPNNLKNLTGKTPDLKSYRCPDDNVKTSINKNVPNGSFQTFGFLSINEVVALVVKKSKFDKYFKEKPIRFLPTSFSAKKIL